MTRYWVGVASREHVLRGVAGDFCQICHGKEGPLARMKPGDWIVYYSPTERFGEKEPCRKFTAMGKIAAGEPYQHQMAPNFTPWRRDVVFVQSNDAAIEPLLPVLFIYSREKELGIYLSSRIFRNIS